MKKQILAISTVIALILGAGAALADTTLFTPMLSAPSGGALVCNATNVGKKTLPNIGVTLQGDGFSSSTSCSDVVPVSTSIVGHTCSRTLSGPALCIITITGGTHRSVRAVLNVVDTDGGTILSVPATK